MTDEYKGWGTRNMSGDVLEAFKAFIDSGQQRSGPNLFMAGYSAAEVQGRRNTDFFKGAFDDAADEVRKVEAQRDALREALEVAERELHEYHAIHTIGIQPDYEPSELLKSTGMWEAS